jgi:Fe-S-cluster containining protein
MLLYREMERQSRFSYVCNACGRCCHDKVITLSPYDIIRIARAAGLATADAIARYTLRRGSLLRFDSSGGCAALDGVRCSIHRGRPLACRLYPLGLERDRNRDCFIALEPAPGSAGVYGDAGTVESFLASQNVDEYFAALERYRALLPLMRDRIAAIVDFERVEPREFWRRAARDALVESNWDANPIIDALFDPDGAGCARESTAATVDAHVARLIATIAAESDGTRLAAAAALLAVSIGLAPDAAATAAPTREMLPETPPAAADSQESRGR